ncbi:Uncharacterized membrane protein (DUF485 family) [Gammaproteobacteria bacterium]
MLSATMRNLLNSGDFKSLVRQRWLVSLSLTVAMLVVYFGFIGILAFDKDILFRKIGAHVTLSIPVGIGVILIAWVLTGAYVVWANHYYDDVVAGMKKKLGES